MKIVKEYTSRKGERVTVSYCDNGEYHVIHEGLQKATGTGVAWFIDRTEAIKHAQFLAGRY